MEQIEIDRRDVIRYGGTGLLTAAILLAIVLVGWSLLRTKSPTDIALDEIRRLPLVAPVMTDNSGIESGMRKAIEEERRNPIKGGGLSRPYSLLADLRRDYMLPALRRADDATAVAAVAARATLVAHMRKTNPAACRQFAIGTLTRPGVLDTEGQQLYGAWLRAYEAAYRSGRASTGPRPLPGRSEIPAMLQQGGFRQPDLERLAMFRNLSNEVSCDIELKVDSVPPLLPAEKRGPFARYLMTN